MIYEKTPFLWIGSVFQSGLTNRLSIMLYKRKPGFADCTLTAFCLSLKTHFESSKHYYAKKKEKTIHRKNHLKQYYSYVNLLCKNQAALSRCATHLFNFINWIGLFSAYNSRSCNRRKWRWGWECAVNHNVKWGKIWHTRENRWKSKKELLYSRGNNRG